MQLRPGEEKMVQWRQWKDQYFDSEHIIILFAMQRSERIGFISCQYRKKIDRIFALTKKKSGDSSILFVMLIIAHSIWPHDISKSNNHMKEINNIYLFLILLYICSVAFLKQISSSV